MFPYQNRQLSSIERTADLLSRMTVKEKIGQLVKMDGFRSYVRKGDDFFLTEEFKERFEKYPIGSMYGLVRADWWTERNQSSGITPEHLQKAVCLFRDYVRKNSRLHIPLYVAEEAPHGLVALGATVFPTGLGMGAMFDVEMAEKIGNVIGEEAKGAGVQSVYSPIIDIPQDPRWSRTEEDFSEDPLLVSCYGTAFVKAIQKNGVTSTLKHFVAHGFPEGGHNSAPVHLGMNEFFNIQSKPFRDAIKAGAKSIMSAYHCLDNEPCSGSHYLLTDILRSRFGFDGFVVSDRCAIRLLKSQRFTEDDPHASAMSIKAGCDVDEHDNPALHFDATLEAYEKGLITDADLDRAAGRILKVKFEMGLFDEGSAQTDCTKVGTPAHREVALEAARKSMTLLKNDGVLPLDDSYRKIAVIGPNANNVMNQLGDYTAPQMRNDVITVLDGLKAECSERGIKVEYAQGCRIRLKDKSEFTEALNAASDADLIIFVPGGSSTRFASDEVRTATGASEISKIEDSSTCDKESGEGTDRATLTYSGVQLDLFFELSKLGKKLVVVPIQGRPLCMNEFLDRANAVLCAWYPGMCGGTAIAETLFGKNNPAGRLPVSLPYHEGQLPVFYYTLYRDRRNYIDMEGNPRLPFGFGLSYTTFAYSGLTVKDRIASVKVTNTGKRNGEEVVQFYITALSSSVLRPAIQMCGFERIALNPGESRNVSIELTDDILGYYTRDLNFCVEAQKYELSCGGNCQDLQTVSFEI